MAKYKEAPDQVTFERIEAYLNQYMNAEERLAFERELDADELLRNEVALQRRLVAAAEVFSHPVASTASIESAPVASVRKIRSWMWYAASVAVVLLVVWVYNRKAQTADKLFADYFIPDTGLPVVMSGGEADYDFYDGMVSYKEEDYNRAIVIWKELYKKQASNDTLRYYMGVAYLNSNNPEAIPHLLAVAENEESSWKTKATWYLALAYLKEGRNDEAVVWLDKLKDDEQAVVLKAAIKKLPH